jgi:hypothetical protein
MLGFAPAVLALLAVLAVAAWAQSDKGTTNPGGTAAGTPPSAGDTSLAAPMMPATSGYTITFPAGTTLTPDSPNWPWPKVPEMARHWYGGGGGVKEALLHVYTFHTDVTTASFKDFTKALLDDFQALDKAEQEKIENDKTGKLKQAVGLEKTKLHFKLGDAGKINTPWDVNGNLWNHLAVQDLRNETQPVNYSILSTFYGNRIYTITLIYLTDLNPQIRDTAQQIMSSLKVDGATGPLGVEVMPSTMPPGATPGSSTMPSGAGGAAAKPAGHP